MSRSGARTYTPRPELVDIRDAAPALDLTGSTPSTAAFQAVLDGLTPGAVLTIPTGSTVNLSGAAVTGSKRVTLSAPGVSFINNGSTASFRITAPMSGSRFEGFRVQGNKISYLGNAGHKAFWIDGNPSAWVDDLRFSNIAVDGHGYGGWFGTNVSNLTTVDTRVTNCGYVGTQILSGRGVRLVRPYVVGLAGYYVNGYWQSYPVAFTRDQTKPITDYPNSEDCEVTGGYVASTGWEGIDTHGGRRIRVLDTEIHGCMFGVALVPCPDQSGNDQWGPQDVEVRGVRVYGDSSTGAVSCGIRLVGAGSQGQRVEAATGIISDCLVVDCGPGPSDPATTAGAVQLYQTQGVVIASQRIIRPAHFGLALYYDNRDIQVSGLYVEDPWSPTFAQPAAVGITNSGNSLTLSHSRMVNTGAKAGAAYANKAGIRVAYNTNTVELGAGINFDAAAAFQSGGTTGAVSTRCGTRRVAMLAAAPTVGVWALGDERRKTAPAASSSPGDVCVTAGGASSQVWAATTAYTIGAWVRTAAGVVLECITAGTSGAVEPTLATVDTTAVDGTVTWRCRSLTSVVWKAVANLGA